LILVTIGLGGGMWGFSRLVSEMDRIAGSIDEKVVMQIGATDYEPENSEYFTFLARNEMDQFYRDARVVVCHAGVGSILTAIKYNKPLVLVPRVKRYGEILDDHQRQIAGELEGKGVAVVYDINTLESAIKTATPGEFHSEREGLISKLRGYLKELEPELNGAQNGCDRAQKGQ